MAGNTAENLAERGSAHPLFHTDSQDVIFSILSMINYYIVESTGANLYHPIINFMVCILVCRRLPKNSPHSKSSGLKHLAGMQSVASPVCCCKFDHPLNQEALYQDLGFYD